MTDRELMQQALDALGWTDEWRPDGLKEQAIAALRERLAKPEQKPVAVARVDDLERGGRVRALAMNLSLDAPLYTAPPQRKPLLASDIVTMYDENPRSDSEMIAFARAIEAAHGIKGEA